MGNLDTLKQMIIDGDEGASAQTEALLAQGVGAREILDQALLLGMEEVGRRMKSGQSFIPEVLLSANLMQECLDIVRPNLGSDESSTLATVMIGTVEGDVHDIGKNLVAMLLAAAGFEVMNLGKDIAPAEFVKAVQEHKPAILGMSGLLTTTIPKMPATIEALKAAGLRDSVKVIVGGAPVTEEYAKEIGADAYGSNASTSVDWCKALIGIPVQS